MGSVVRLSGTGLAVFLAIAPVSAHHVPAAKFDPAKPVTLTGVVTKVEWLNPHVHVFVDVPDSGSRANWAIELESTVDLKRSGWSRDTLKVGDAITVQGMAARDGSTTAWGNSVVVTSTGRRVFTVTPAEPPRVQAAQPTPRWPDGQPRLGPPPGQIMGYWAFPSATTLAEQGTAGANVQADQYGQLRNIADIDKVAPFQRWARDLYELRQRNFQKDDPMFIFCKPQSGPRIFQLPYGVQFLEERENQRIRVMMGAGNQNWRFIYTDGRAQTAFPKENADNPLYWGRAVGKWDGDTLVVNTDGFNDSFWLSNGGLPHTQQLRLTERFSRPDLNTLRYEVTIDDPGAYTRPWSSSWTLRWVPDEELPIYYCQDNRP
jgi:Family of unknown function (DUF6152)